MHDMILTKSKKWQPHHTKKVFGRILQIYRDSLLDPHDQNHRNVIKEAMEILPIQYRKDPCSVANRLPLLKKHFIAILKKERNLSEDSSKVINESSNQSSNHSKAFISLDWMEDTICKGINVKLNELFNEFIRPRFEQEVVLFADRLEKDRLSLIENFKQFLSLVDTGKLPNVATPTIAPPAVVEVVKEIVSTFPTTQVISPFQEALITAPSIEEESEDPPIVKISKGVFHVAIIGIMKKDQEFIKKATDAIRRNLEFYWFVSDPNKIKVKKIQAGMDKIFISKVEGLTHAATEKLLARYSPREHVIVQHHGGKSEFARMIVDWSIEEYTKRNGFIV